MRVRSERHDSPKPHLWEVTTTMETPAGPLTQIKVLPKDGGEGRIREHYVKTVEDARGWLSVPDRKVAAGVASYFDLARATGDRALLMVSIPHALYTVQQLTGSETLAFWFTDERALLREMVDRAFAHVEALAKHYLAHGIGDCYGWVGPEVCIPPLASPRDFREFVVEYDRRIAGLVHDAGKLVWVHCHGDMNPVLEGFIEIGTDCLNPIEPPPTGKLTLTDAKRRAGGRLCLEGGVQQSDFDLLAPPLMACRVEAVVAEGKPGGGFILCPTASPMTWPSLNERHTSNYRAFVETAIRLASYRQS
ncbi:MAG: hypothetical protein HY321_04815 [Armatimonadetes bacterium]|nr:hypothetical protein [Armatimonadota bacterium]